MIPAPKLSRFVAAEYAGLAKAADEAIAAGKVSREDAEMRLRAWLAIGCLVGAGIPQVEERLADITFITLRGDRKRAEELARHNARLTLARDYCSPMRWSKILAETRNKALDQHAAKPSEKTEGRARALIALAEALDVTIPYNPRGPLGAASKKDAA